jgi:glycosyltransferase involved in cell wall biosynthesis
MNNSLSICIPTYNRSIFLKTNLEQLINLCKPLQIPIYISDNCSTDDTGDMVAKMKEKYNFIFYKKLKENRGIDFNMDSVLNMSQTKFGWLFSDDDEMHEESIAYISELINTEDPSFILSSYLHKRLDTREIIGGGNLVESDSYEIISPTELLEKHAVAMTLLSACIIRIDLWKAIKYEDYKSQYYIHLFNILTHVLRQPKIIVVGKRLFTRFAGNDWEFKKEDIGFIVPYFYPKTIDSLNGYSYLSKYYGIKNKKNSRITVGTLLRLRSQLKINFIEFPKSYFPLTNVLLPVFITLLLMPIALSTLLLTMLKTVKAILSNE